MQNAEIVRQRLRLYGISCACGRPLEEAVEQALLGGVTMIQLREKHLPEGELLSLARRVKCVTDRYGVPLLINDRADIAGAVGAAGAHLGLADGDLRQARALLGPEAMLGATARSVDQALAAEAAGADYLGCGAVFGTFTKADATVMPLKTLREICSAVRIPVVAIGGIGAENIQKLQGCGMAGFAVVSAIFGAENIEHAARALRGLAEEVLCPTQS